MKLASAYKAASVVFVIYGRPGPVSSGHGPRYSSMSFRNPEEPIFSQLLKAVRDIHDLVKSQSHSYSSPREGTAHFCWVLPCGEIRIRHAMRLSCYRRKEVLREFLGWSPLRESCRFLYRRRPTGSKSSRSLKGLATFATIFSANTPILRLARYSRSLPVITDNTAISDWLFVIQ